jgi:16S rRNA C967 or C1407 C5-methylase (RsmB/RsmF family)
MATERENDLVAFRKFVDEQLSNGGAKLTLNEVLARWENENQTPEERQNSMQALEQSLKHTGSSNDQSFNEVLEDFRKKHGLTLPARTLQSNPEEWVKRLNELVASQTIRPTNMDDSRESIYAGRGE